MIEIKRTESCFKPYTIPGHGECSNIILHHGGTVLFQIGRGWFDSRFMDYKGDLNHDVTGITIEGYNLPRRRTEASGLGQGGHFVLSDPKNKTESKWGLRYHLYLDMVPEVLPEQESYRGETHQKYITPARLVIPNTQRVYVPADKLTIDVDPGAEGNWRLQARSELFLTWSMRAEIHEEGKVLLALQEQLAAAGIKLDMADVQKVNASFTLTPR